jgi:hypothetical protein
MMSTASRSATAQHPAFAENHHVVENDVIDCMRSQELRQCAAICDDTPNTFAQFGEWYHAGLHAAP